MQIFPKISEANFLLLASVIITAYVSSEQLQNLLESIRGEWGFWVVVVVVGWLIVALLEIRPILIQEKVAALSLYYIALAVLAGFSLVDQLQQNSGGAGIAQSLSAIITAVFAIPFMLRGLLGALTFWQMLDSPDETIEDVASQFSSKQSTVLELVLVVLFGFIVTYLLMQSSDEGLSTVFLSYSICLVALSLASKFGWRVSIYN